MIIQVDPSLLQSGAKQIQGISGNISSSVKDLLSKIQNAPSYEGQFGPKIAEIGNEIGTRGERFSDVLINLGERLGLKGIEFANVDDSAISRFNDITGGLIDWSDPHSLHNQYLGLLDILKSYLFLGNLLKRNGSNFSLVALIATVLGTNRQWNGWTFFGMEQPSWWPSWLPWTSQPPESIVFPVADKSPKTKTRFGDLLKEPAPATIIQTNNTSTETLRAASSSAQATTTPTLDSTTIIYEVYYDVPVESQGTLNNYRACAPTSVSMVLNYYHAQNEANTGATTEQLLAPLNAGGKEIALTNMTNEIKGLGYQNITVKVSDPQVKVTLSDLQSALKDGPVIVTAGVKIVGPGTVISNIPRAIEGPGSTIHALVVKGFGKDTVIVNDSWSGKELQLSNATFTKMWDRGSNGMYAIRP